MFTHYTGHSGTFCLLLISMHDTFVWVTWKVEFCYVSTWFKPSSYALRRAIRTRQRCYIHAEFEICLPLCYKWSWTCNVSITNPTFYVYNDHIVKVSVYNVHMYLTVTGCIVLSLVQGCVQLWEGATEVWRPTSLWICNDCHFAR